MAGSCGLVLKDVRIELQIIISTINGMTDVDISEKYLIPITIVNAVIEKYKIKPAELIWNCEKQEWKRKRGEKVNKF